MPPPPDSRRAMSIPTFRIRTKTQRQSRVPLKSRVAIEVEAYQHHQQIPIALVSLSFLLTFALVFNLTVMCAPCLVFVGGDDDVE